MSSTAPAPGVLSGEGGTLGLLAAATNAVARARRVATQLGPDSSRVWDLLELAVDVERATLNLDAELEAVG